MTWLLFLKVRVWTEQSDIHVGVVAGHCLNGGQLSFGVDRFMFCNTTMGHHVLPAFSCQHHRRNQLDAFKEISLFWCDTDSCTRVNNHAKHGVFLQQAAHVGCMRQT